jgi:tellurite resistance protein
MGLAGTAIAFNKAEALLVSNLRISWFILGLASISFMVICLFYLLKLLRFSQSVINEFNNPVRISFFPAISIGLILLSIGFIEINSLLSFALVSAGTILQLILSIAVISEWIRQDRFEIKHMNPSWFIPAVGNILVPVAGINFFPEFVSWFFFSIGFVFWIILFVIFFYRVVFHHPMQEKLLPTLFILIAPPAVGFISYFKLTGHIDHLSYCLFSTALFLFIILLSMGRMFLKIRFYLSWWAYSFPIAALTIASFIMYSHERMNLLKYLSFSLLGLLTVLIVFLGIRTIISIRRKEFCVEE